MKIITTWLDCVACCTTRPCMVIITTWLDCTSCCTNKCMWMITTTNNYFFLNTTLNSRYKCMRWSICGRCNCYYSYTKFIFINNSNLCKRTTKRIARSWIWMKSCITIFITCKCYWIIIELNVITISQSMINFNTLWSSTHEGMRNSMTDSTFSTINIDCNCVRCITYDW